MFAGTNVEVMDQEATDMDFDDASFDAVGSFGIRARQRDEPESTSVQAASSRCVCHCSADRDAAAHQA
jgi:hypothetical protein